MARLLDRSAVHRPHGACDARAELAGARVAPAKSAPPKRQRCAV